MSSSYCDGNELNRVRRASNERMKQNVIKSSSCADDKGYLNIKNKSLLL